MPLINQLDDGSLTFKLLVVPRASRSEVVGEHEGALRVRIAAPPVNGAANEEVTRLISGLLKVSRGAVNVVKGQTSKRKIIRVHGAAVGEVAKLFARK